MSAFASLLPADERGAWRDRRLFAILSAAGIASMALVGWLIAGAEALPLLLGVGVGATIVAAAALLFASRRPQANVSTIDWSVVRSTLEDGISATAITLRAGRLVCANPRYEDLSGIQEAGGGLAMPDVLAFADDGSTRLADAVRAAWRDGTAELGGLVLDRRAYVAALRRAGPSGEYLVWRFLPARRLDPAQAAAAMIHGPGGRRLSDQGVMAIVAGPEGLLHAGNAVFARRALGDDAADIVGRRLADLVVEDEAGTIRLVREVERDGDACVGLRVIPVPFGPMSFGEEGSDTAQTVTVFLLLDEEPALLSTAAARDAATGHLHELLAILPLGLALAERDGRLLFMNDAFRRAAGIGQGDPVIYPSDLVCEEDKGTVIEAVRRFARGRALPGDLAVRLKGKVDEPVALTIANAKGLGDAAVLLSLKDGSEESTLKRQVAQATRMQAVGQLAGGVAHDFNNILTAIIGHCDLMAMRHTPGDTDYDDIQQIRDNSNRAAALTRQLLAFSRQQTLRPQILHLPEVVSEVTQLLRRLLGETIRLEVRHGRNLGLVRADPGQLEQVIVNLAVNGRDAMPDGGTLTLETYSMSAADVRRMRSEIMPIGDYTALRVSDTGCGIPAGHLSKIFEPFFTTKEVNKGTGLGLSTVYGIVKQTDGFIFADSEVGHGTSFVIYLPVHHVAQPPEPARTPPTRSGELWGTGTILLVEDEAMVRAIGERALARQGYRVLTASNGEEALDLLASEAGIDLLVSDVVMPGMDGPALVARARALYPALRILFMSGYAEEQLRQSIDEDGIAFLSKPFSVQQLGQAARDALAANPG